MPLFGIFGKKTEYTKLEDDDAPAKQEKVEKEKPLTEAQKAIKELQTTRVDLELQIGAAKIAGSDEATDPYIARCKAAIAKIDTALKGKV